jgi:hypothetical protein
MKKLATALLLLVVPASLAAGSHFWIIGGGPAPYDSQAQIEFNVTWVIASLRELVPDAVINVFYANGIGPEKATVELVPDGEDAVPFEALARVYGETEGQHLRYREHRVPDVMGTTRKDSLLPTLERQLSALGPGDQAMIVYNGHGTQAPDRANNALRLWGESRLDVREFEALLGRVDPAVPVRFVFTQCYSGAFARAVHPGAADVLELAPGTRCGFFAESDARQSEGCSASILVGDYRDYTTYFFAALTGVTRLGETLTERTDWDGDGRITPFDAHLFALVEGRNADLPRSTSEVYLERWQPWYFRWMDTGRLPDNLYGRAARAMAEATGLPTDGRDLGAALERRYEDVLEQVRAAEAARGASEQRAGSLQATLQRSVAERWPELSHPYTRGYDAVLSGELETIEAFLTAGTEYGSLVRAQEEMQARDLELVELERDLSHLEKLRRTRFLARSLAQLERRGSGEHREAYARLRACEALPLG